MNFTTLLPEPPDVFGDCLCPSGIVVIHEDGNAEHRAMEFVAEVFDHDGADCESATSDWGFDALESGEIGHVAAGAAARASFVIVAASGDLPLSPEVHEWLGMWTWRIGETSPALVVLLENADGKCAGRIRSELSALAQRHDLEFITFHHQTSAQPCGGMRDRLALATEIGTRTGGIEPN
jgi:hypothetical protein